MACGDRPACLRVVAAVAALREGPRQAERDIRLVSGATPGAWRLSRAIAGGHASVRLGRGGASVVAAPVRLV
jgi:hypothetical protein